MNETNFLAPLNTEGHDRVISSFTGDNAGAAIMRYTQTAQSIDALEEKPQEIENVILHDVEVVDTETGEITEAVRTVLITPKGEAFAAVSQGVINSLQMICNPNVFGPPPWSPPIKLEMIRVKTKKNFYAKRLVPVLK